MKTYIPTPLHRRSRMKGHCEAGFWRVFDKAARAKMFSALKAYELKHRQDGRRRGPIGHIAIEIVEQFFKCIDFKTGQLDPSLDYLQRELKRSRDAVVRALKALRACGFLDWINRFEVGRHAGAKGQQVKQATNAYRLILPTPAALATPAPDTNAGDNGRRSDKAGARRLSSPVAQGQLDLLEAAVKAALPPENQ